MQMSPEHYAFVTIVIRTEIKKRRARGVIRRDDAEDIASELMAQLLGVWEQYDPARGSREAFINQVVSTRLVSILRDRHAAKRRAFVEPLADRETAQDGRVGERPDALRRACLRMDLKAVIERLRPEDRELCEWLQRDALKPVAEEKGIPRRTLRDRAARIRNAFRDARLDEYLE